MQILYIFFLQSLVFGIPGGLIAWFVVSLVRYIKAPKDMRNNKVGMLVASSVTLGVVLTLSLWLISTFMQDISFM